MAKKGSNVRILNVTGLSSVADYFVIVTGEADTHVNAIAEAIHGELVDTGIKPSGKEGLKGGRWVLLDYVDVVAHIFIDPVRRFYALEKLWGDAPSESVG